MILRAVTVLLVPLSAGPCWNGFARRYATIAAALAFPRLTVNPVKELCTWYTKLAQPDSWNAATLYRQRRLSRKSSVFFSCDSQLCFVSRMTAAKMKRLWQFLWLLLLMRPLWLRGGDENGYCGKVTAVGGQLTGKGA